MGEPYPTGGGQHGPSDQDVQQLQEAGAVRGGPGESEGHGEDWDSAAWRLLADDGERRGYVCRKPFCECGKHFTDYLREAGIIGGYALKRIRKYEVASLNEGITEGDL